MRQKEDRKNRVRKRRVFGWSYGTENSWKGHKERHRHLNRIKRSGQARLVHVKNINGNIPTTWRWAPGDLDWGQTPLEITGAHQIMLLQCIRFHSCAAVFVTRTCLFVCTPVHKNNNNKKGGGRFSLQCVNRSDDKSKSKTAISISYVITILVYSL